jgi:predicted nuclease of predicted toxin-antitoxin system
MRFLIDECLSPSLVSIAHQVGYEAEHVAHIGKAGWVDWNVADYAVAGDLVLVTNNRSDFLRLYATRPIHAGLVILIPNVGRIVQRRLFGEALTELAKIGEPINRVLEVNMDGDDVTFDFYHLPESL